MKEILHKFGIHDYGNWKIIVNEPYGLNLWHLVQEKTCKICGKKKIKNETK